MEILDTVSRMRHNGARDFPTDLTDDGRVGETTLPSCSDLFDTALDGTKPFDELLLTIERSDLSGKVC